MCGLTALVLNDLTNSKSLNDLILFEKLTKLSSERGRDTSGVYLVLKSSIDNDVFSFAFKANGTSNYIFNSFHYLEIKKQIAERLLILLLAVSHTRMATVGDTEDPSQNQPLVSEISKLFFNGIVINDLSNNSSLYLPENINDGWRYINFSFEHINENFGIANLLRFNERKGILEIFTNNGDLFKVDFGGKTFISSDDRFIRDIFPSMLPTGIPKKVVQYFQSKPVDISQHINIRTGLCPVRSQISNKISTSTLSELSQIIKSKKINVWRCSLCGSPEISKPNKICQKCKIKGQKKYLGHEQFSKVIERVNSSKNPILLGLSGGRDSSYVLSQLVEKWNVKNLVTYTFDWGVNTPYARNNVSKLCGKYGIRNILVAADIRKKRRDVRSVVKSYCRNPVPGLVPLLMAGDKQFISTAKKISIQLNSSAEIFGFNPFEKTRFKEELIWKNLWPEQDDGLYGEDLPFFSQLKLILGYSQKIILNPSYWGRNLLDAARGFINYYHSGVERTNYFDYFEWNEKLIDQKLYDIGWFKPVGRSSWRIGDGTSAFYNLAYLLHQGWCENDTLRANQVRSGHIQIDESRELLEIDNTINVEMLEWYFSILELDPNKYLNKLIQRYQK